MSIHEKFSHIDQLKEWWENAVKGTPRPGDAIIRYNPTDGPNFIILVADEVDAEGNDPECWGTRILARAPKPKPAWHNAPAVFATGDSGDGDLFTGIWIPHVSPEWWECADVGIILGSEQLYDVTPLIEAKVTDEMVERARDYMSINTGQTHTHKAIRGVLSAALSVSDRD